MPYSSSFHNLDQTFIEAIHMKAVLYSASLACFIASNLVAFGNGIYPVVGNGLFVVAAKMLVG